MNGGTTPAAGPPVTMDVLVRAQATAQGAAPVGGGALADLLTHSRPQRSVRTPVSPSVTRALWTLTVGDSAVAAWLAAVLTGRLGCRGLPCRAATLLGHPGLALGLAVAALLTLLVTAVPTGAFRAATTTQLVVLWGAAGASVGVLLGPVVVLVVAAALAAALLVVAVGVLVALFDR
jgi:hypothetical protein